MRIILAPCHFTGIVSTLNLWQIGMTPRMLLLLLHCLKVGLRVHLSRTDVTALERSETWNSIRSKRRAFDGLDFRHGPYPIEVFPPKSSGAHCFWSRFPESRRTYTGTADRAQRKRRYIGMITYGHWGALSIDETTRQVET